MGGSEVMEVPQHPRKLESRHMLWLRLQGKFGGQGPMSKVYVQVYGENETGRRSKDLNIIGDTTTLQDTAGYKRG